MIIIIKKYKNSYDEYMSCHYDEIGVVNDDDYSDKKIIKNINTVKKIYKVVK